MPTHAMTRRAFVGPARTDPQVTATVT
jgi:hypothetical protein